MKTLLSLLFISILLASRAALPPALQPNKATTNAVPPYIETSNSTGTNTSYFGVGRWINATGSLSTVLSAANAGDTIFVGPGRYTNNNLLKPGVNWYFAPGAVVWYQQLTTNDAGWGLFDDRTSGATTNYIQGYGDFWFLKGTNGAGTDGAYQFNLNTRGLLVVTNSLSEIHFQAQHAYHAGVDGVATSALDLENYQRVFIDVDEILDPWVGLTITLKDTDDGTDDYTSNASAVHWGVGSEAHVKVRRIVVSQYGLWGDDTLATDPGNHNKACNFWFSGDYLGSKLYINCVSTNYRSWINVKELTGGNPTSIYGSGKHYLEFEKLESTASGQPTLDVNGNYGGGSNVVVWLNAQKVSSRGQWIGYLGGVPGQFSTVYASVQHYEDLGTISTGFVASATTEIHLNGGYAKLNSGVGIRHDGGNTFVDGLTIDNSGGAKSPIEVTGSGLSLKNTRLIGPSSTNSIGANSAKTVAVWSSSSANQSVNANITISPNVDFEIDGTGPTSANVALLDRSPQIFTGSNTFPTVSATTLTVSGAVTINGVQTNLSTVYGSDFQAPTNTWTPNTALAIGKEYDITSGAGTIGVGTFSGVPSSTYSVCTLRIKATGTVTFTNDNSVGASDFTISRTLTNGNWATISFEIIPRQVTNMFFVQTK